MKLIKNILVVLVPLTLFSGTAFSQTKEELKKKYENSSIVASPGKKIQMKEHITSFLEHYKYFIDFIKRPCKF
ncbi:hypothetical protein [Sphingobacterium sp.]|uniref:hypothetical protein n=1 Tax=Sphingobacterium sp. TaxID=341027 RepID=UPI0031E2AD9B